MHIESFKSYVELDERDAERLRALWPHVEPVADDICADFYQRIISEPTTSPILSDAETVRRLMASLRVWMEELLHGPWDTAYARRRMAVGHVHVRVGVPHDAMFTAMCVIRAWLTRLAIQESDEPAETVAAILKVTDLDLSLMTSSFHQKLQEQAMRDVQSLIVRHMPAIVLLVDRGGFVHAATAAVRNGSVSGGAADGQIHFSELLPQPLVEAAELSRRIDQALREMRPMTVARVDCVVDEEERHFALTVVPLEHAEPMAIVYFEDHTVAVQNEGLLRRQESLAQLGALSATIAHELRNPLAGISGALQVIASRLQDHEEYGSVIVKVLDQIRSLDRLVSDLLAFARPRAAKETQDVAVRAIVDSVADFIRGEFPDITVEIDGELSVDTDPDMVRQIISNLAINACQSMQGGGAMRITLSDRTVTVADSGSGISTDAVAHIWEPFYTTKTRGTGLGLAISRRLARTVGATLRLVETSADGTTFELRFD